MENTTYNGWTNYETWNWFTWMNNEQSSQEYWNELTDNIKENVTPQFDWQTTRDAHIIALVDALEADMEEKASYQDNVGPFADIMNAGLSRIVWREIAKSLLDS